MAPKPPTAPEPTRLMQYVYANVLWYLFLGIVVLLTFLASGRVWDDVMREAAKFLFLILGGGFTLVSLLDSLYEKRFESSEGGRP